MRYALQLVDADNGAPIEVMALERAHAKLSDAFTGLAEDPTRDPAAWAFDVLGAMFETSVSLEPEPEPEV